MINFLLGLSVGGIIAIFVYRNNKKTIGKLYDKLDEVYGQLRQEKHKKTQ